jgi:hypothetical protein
MVESIITLQNRGTAEHVRLCERPDRQSPRVALVYEGDAMRYNPQIVRGAPLGEWGDEWVYVEMFDGGLKGYIHRAYLVLERAVAPPPMEPEEAPAEPTE